jgi:hypothetical protein
MKVKTSNIAEHDAKNAANENHTDIVHFKKNSCSPVQIRAMT